jgi:hypothetical protein
MSEGNLNQAPPHEQALTHLREAVARLAAGGAKAAFFAASEACRPMVRPSSVMTADGSGAFHHNKNKCKNDT